MAYQKRIPPVKIELTINEFNLLLEMLTRYTLVDNENLVEQSKKMKNKLLRYSIPRINDENEELVDIRFFPNEASEIIYILINNTHKIDIKANYYEILLKVRETIKEEFKNNS